MTTNNNNNAFIIIIRNKIIKRLIFKCIHELGATPNKEKNKSTNKNFIPIYQSQNKLNLIRRKSYPVKGSRIKTLKLESIVGYYAMSHYFLRPMINTFNEINTDNIKEISHLILGDVSFGGHINIFKYLIDQGIYQIFEKEKEKEKENNSGSDCLQEHDDIFSMESLTIKEEPIQHLLDLAASNGQQSMFDYLSNNIQGLKCTTEAMDGASKNGHLNLVKWLNENRTEGCTINAMTMASENGYSDVVRYLYENRTAERCVETVMDHAAAHGDLDLFIYLHEDNRDNNRMSHRAFYWAVRGNHLPLVQYIHQNTNHYDLPMGLLISKYGDNKVRQYIQNEMNKLQDNQN
ncbi:hypothetical protein DFA_12247 [Cavenderia fasciculata]|uniref:Ankyrin repeat-containing protein n=1 Tax=Cavenderia fasciculata TaxID=261658 RepID=F4QCV1_CACFS|nr:uncharacterized protein DFA_12247 [Cavenderia fasciculata]EGG14475.1 hypothetical protein DFA_12247 [Cavenderia fasciculata]|eukprot:XP_004353884.1 hypothetical protein DFA_12247 [Cavenderia fasciculata]